MSGLPIMDFGSIPDDWEAVAVREVISESFCGPSPDCDEREIREANEWGVLKTTAITWAGWNPRAHKTLPRAYWNHPELEVKPGDVLVTKAGPRHRVGVVAEVDWTPPHLIVSGKMIALRPNRDRVVPRILSAALSLPGPQKFIDHRTTGMAESQVNFANDVLLSTEIALPKIEEQDCIAKVLDTLDLEVRKTEQIIEKLEATRRGILFRLFPPGRLLRNKTGDIKAMPGWVPQRVVDITDPGTAICYGIVQVGAYDPQGVPVLAIRDLAGSYGPDLNRASRSIEVKYARSRIQPGDVLLSIKGTIGRVGVVPNGFYGNISRELARLRLKSHINPFFIKLLLESEFGAKLLDLAVVGTTRAEVSIGVLKKLPIAIPSRDVQTEIVDLIGIYDAKLSLEMDLLNKLQNLKVGLSFDLLAGRVRTRPN